jgi:CHASE2 domain-containing sensor protein
MHLKGSRWGDHMIREAKLHLSSALPVMLQLLVMCAVSLLFSLLAWELKSKTPLNLVWIIVTPLAIGYALNNERRRIRMLILLPAASFLGIGIVAAMIGYP